MHSCQDVMSFLACSYFLYQSFFVNFFFTITLDKLNIYLLLTLHAYNYIYLLLTCLLCIHREHAPSIIFMDEIDSIGSSRLEGGSGGKTGDYLYFILKITVQIKFENLNNFAYLI